MAEHDPAGAVVDQRPAVVDLHIGDDLEGGAHFFRITHAVHQELLHAAHLAERDEGLHGDRAHQNVVAGLVDDDVRALELLLEAGDAEDVEALQLLVVINRLQHVLARIRIGRLVVHVDELLAEALGENARIEVNADAVVADEVVPRQVGTGVELPVGDHVVVADAESPAIDPALLAEHRDSIYLPALERGLHSLL